MDPKETCSGRRPRRILPLLFAILTAAAIIGAFFVGWATAEPGFEITYGTTFYAVIEEIDGETLLVQGLEINNADHRGRFVVTLDEHTELKCRYTPMALEELEVGQNISITYSGRTPRKDPGELRSVVEINLLI